MWCHTGRPGGITIQEASSKTHHFDDDAVTNPQHSGDPHESSQLDPPHGRSIAPGEVRGEMALQHAEHMGGTSALVVQAVDCVVEVPQALHRCGHPRTTSTAWPYYSSDRRRRSPDGSSPAPTRRAGAGGNFDGDLGAPGRGRRSFRWCLGGCQGEVPAWGPASPLAVQRWDTFLAGACSAQLPAPGAELHGR
jgi:hypothetical protein